MDVLLFIVIILVASILQTSTGFGFSILATPFLLLLFEPLEAIQMNLALSLVISLALITKIKQDIDTDILKRFIIGSIVGLPLGIITFLLIDIKQLKLGISIIILLLTLLLMAHFRIQSSKKKGFFSRWDFRPLDYKYRDAWPSSITVFFGNRNQKGKITWNNISILFVYLFSELNHSCNFCRNES